MTHPNKFIFVPPENHEWPIMWQKLADQYNAPDFLSKCPQTGEVWQYMGTVAAFDNVYHEFRHRNHPTTNTRLNVKIHASDAFFERHKLAPPPAAPKYDNADYGGSIDAYGNVFSDADPGL